MKFEQFRWIGIVLLIIIVCFTAFWLFRDQSVSDEALFGTRDVTYVVEVYTTDTSILDELKIGDTLISQETKQKANIESYESFTDSTHVTVDAQAHYRGPFMSIGGQIIKVGKDHFIKTETVELKGRIINLEYGGQDD